nr:Chain H, Nuclear receptor coactivator 1 [synthetic construct]3H0A_B Chain B, Nuclear receptor coactivator 1, Co-activator Peptide [Homo sapiens]3H0A_E Chain E, Nuclear receptor coactivator 1, Co-activator Peptide [Homo sapiens]
TSHKLVQLLTTT